MENCIFCSIAKGEIPKNFIYESENVMAFDDINPEAPVHILILPKKHIKSVNEITNKDNDLLSEIFQVVRDIAKNKKITDKGYRLIINNGKDGGQLIQHLHLHLLGGKSLGSKLIKE